MALKKGLGTRLALALAPTIYKGVFGLLFATCRLQEHDQHHFSPFLQDRRACIIPGWHYGVFYKLYRAYQTSRRHGLRWVFMVSASRDAEFVAAIAHGMGLETARGSKGKGGLDALKKMIALVKEGFCAGIIADGSQGPPRKAQAGVILLASRTGVPIVPIAWAADRYIAFNSWDRTVVPKPFARLGMWYGEPLTVPAKLRSAGLEQYRLELEKRLNDLYEKAWREFGRKEH